VAAGETAETAGCKIEQVEVRRYVGVALVGAVADEREVAAVGRAGAVAVVVVAAGERLDPAIGKEDAEQVRAAQEVALAAPAVDQPGDEAQLFSLSFLGALARWAPIRLLRGVAGPRSRSRSRSRQQTRRDPSRRGSSM
jgi:hypothetical protein